MTNSMQVPRPLYYFLVTAITQFLLAAGALVLLLPTGLLGELPLSSIGFVFSYNIVVATLVAAIVTNHHVQDEAAILKGAGLVIGHLVGLIVGGVAGARYGGPLWAAAGAISLYFVVGWIGSRISLAIGNELAKPSVDETTKEANVTMRFGKPNPSLLFLYGAVIPAVFMAAAVLVRSSGLPIRQYSEELPTARIVIVALSFISVLLPRLRRMQFSKRPSNVFARARAMSGVGIALSMAPAVYGFILYLGFGLSLAELSLFAVAASIATTTWGVGVE